jgi:hypothetical protein
MCWLEYRKWEGFDHIVRDWIVSCPLARRGQLCQYIATREPTDNVCVDDHHTDNRDRILKIMCVHCYNELRAQRRYDYGRNNVQYGRGPSTWY